MALEIRDVTSKHGGNKRIKCYDYLHGKAVVAECDLMWINKMWTVMIFPGLNEVRRSFDSFEEADEFIRFKIVEARF